jgi:hypothetical protein
MLMNWERMSENGIVKDARDVRQKCTFFKHCNLEQTGSIIGDADDGENCVLISKDSVNLYSSSEHVYRTFQVHNFLSDLDVHTSLAIFDLLQSIAKICFRRCEIWGFHCCVDEDRDVPLGFGAV